ncbi:hypothetical protein C8Q75DRAFT_806541 [Abortiporus biennis]|nr:hypothetical protein C8Q75DRAFT_806541 [Abortiporus biennis]
MLSLHPFANIKVLRISATPPRIITPAPFVHDNCLTLLTLKGITILWKTAFVYDSLRDLTLIDLSLACSDAFLDMLRRCKFLEHLEIANFIPDIDDVNHSKTNSRRTSRVFMSACIDVPITTKVILDASEVDETHVIRGLYAILPVDTSGLPHIQETETIWMDTENPGWLDFIFKGRHAALIQISLRCVGSDTVRIPYLAEFDASYLNSLRDIFSRSAISELSVNIAFDDLEAEVWIIALSSFPSLTSLTVDEYEDRDGNVLFGYVFHALRSPPRPYINAGSTIINPTPNLVCPRLSHLHIYHPVLDEHNLDVMEETLGERSQHSIFDDYSLFKALLNQSW